MICPLQEKTTKYSANYASHTSRGSKAVDFTAPANRVINGKTYYTTKGAKLYAAASGTVIKSTYSATATATISLSTTATDFLRSTLTATLAL